MIAPLHARRLLARTLAGHLPSLFGRLDRAALDRLRDLQVRRVVGHAGRRVPHHRDLLRRHGIEPDEIRAVADLARLPLTTKKDLQEAEPRRLLAEGLDPSSLIERRTTGSTGQPIRIRRTWLEERLLGAHRWRALRSMGARSRDRTVEIEELGAIDPNDHSTAHRLLQGFGLLRQTRIHATAPPDEIVAALAAAEPDVLCGYAGVIARLAHLAAELDLSRLAPRLVVVHSDTLTGAMRRAIGDAFRAPVRELYDCNEVNVIAWECATTGDLHVSDDTAVVEVLRADGAPAEPGEWGEVVLTALHSFAMPLVRYAIGDLVIQGARRCACGAPFSTIRAVRGRMFDYFPLADGRVVHPYELIGILEREAPWLLRYRILQERRDHVTLTMVAGGEPAAPAAVTRVQTALERFLGPAVAVRVELVDDIPLDRGAKTRVCRSLVESSYDEPPAAPAL